MINTTVSTYPCIAKFSDLVQLKDYRPPTKMEYVRYLRRFADHLQRDPPVPGSGATSGGNVTFTYRDAAGQERRCTVSGMEFVRRLLQHVPPKHFQRVRHCGWRAAAAKAKWQRIVAWLDWRAPIPQPSTKSPQPILCHDCGQAMRLIGMLARSPLGWIGS